MIMSHVSEARFLVNLSNTEKRRYFKGVVRLRKHLEPCNIQIICEATKFIAVGNAGLSCGYCEEDLRRELYHPEDIALKHPPTSKILLLTDQPFAIIECCCIDHAEHSLLSLLNRTVSTSRGQTLPWYPVYISALPDSSTSAVFGDRAYLKLPPGLRYISDFISEEKEASLIQFIDDVLSADEGDKNEHVLRNRTTIHFGYQFRYGSNDLDFDKKIHSIPALYDDILRQLVETGCVPFTPDQLTVNVYEPGQGIPPHIDTHSVFEDGICSLSVGGAVVMDFVLNGETLPVLLQPRSLVAMLGESRYAWKHGIVPRATDVLPESQQSWRRRRRISFTFRCAKKIPCRCPYPELCDSQNVSSQKLPCGEDVISSDINESSALSTTGLEDEYVYQVYEKIAPHFSETRHKAWPKIAEFVKAFTPGSVVLDVGCGNGKYMGLNNSIVQIGCDRSSSLLSVCRTRQCEVFVADILNLPFREFSCDGVICIAVIHHLSSEIRRIQALEEIVRVLVIGGQALVYVWAMEQKKDEKKSTYLKAGKVKGEPLNNEVARSAQASPSSCSLPVHVNRTEFVQQDVLVPWHMKSNRGDSPSDKTNGSSEKVYHRFYHVFREGELKRCCEALKDVLVVSEYYDEGNWCVILEKTA